MHLNDFDFHLPPELIAKYPLASRVESKLMILKQNTIQHAQFKNIFELIDAGDLLIFNDTKVIPARLYGKKTSGGRVEILVERIINSKQFRAQLRVSKAPKINDILFINDEVQLKVLDRRELFFDLELISSSINVLEMIESLGEIPLPPYMQRKAETIDKERYQTVYAKDKGSVAAPTAGFHFDENLLDALRNKGVDFAYVTLHVGAGTFAPVRVENIFEHKMHAEFLTVTDEVCEKIKTAKKNHKKIIAVGTTTLRALETASAAGEVKPFCGDTNIFIYPGYQFKSADALITNFHLPSSTLMMLVCAFGGYENLMRAYQKAVEKQYRFYSYGDAMFIIKTC